MFKKFLSGVLAATILLGGATYANTTTADAAKLPTPAKEFTMDKNDKNKKDVVAVARKGDTSSATTGNTETGVLPEAGPAKAKKVKLKYVNGKKGQALYLDRDIKKYGIGYGAELKGVKLGSGSWSVSFWVKADNSMSNFMTIFFTGNKITDPKNTHWVSITHRTDHDNGGDPYIWSHGITGGKNDEFPWYCCQDADGNWVEKSAIAKDKWVHITLVVDTKDTCEYGEKGADGYVKGHHGWTYVNGELYGNGTVANKTMTNSNRFYLGINAWDIPFKGCYDEVKFYKKALSAKEVKAIYKAEK